MEFYKLKKRQVFTLKFPFVFNVLFLLPLLAWSMSGCYSGFTKFNYYWNPYQLLKLSAEALQKNDINLWEQVLTDHALCTLGSSSGLKIIQKFLDHPSQSQYTLGELRLVQKNVNPAGHQVQKRYQIQLLDLDHINTQPKLTITFDCIENSEVSYCRISKILGDFAVPRKTAEVCADLL